MHSPNNYLCDQIGRRKSLIRLVRRANCLNDVIYGAGGRGMFLISLEPVSGLSRSALKGNYTCRRCAVCTKCRGKKMRTRHFAYRTERAYLYWIRRYVNFHNRKHPREMGSREVEAFLTHLAVDEHVSASTQNQALQALLFPYRQVMEIDLSRSTIELSQHRARGRLRYPNGAGIVGPRRRACDDDLHPRAGTGRHGG
jgi:hypothetical protein